MSLDKPAAMNVDTSLQNPLHKQALPQVITIMGPTASGKTALAIELAKAVNGEVISVDSALVYRHMNIGTAKPDEAEMQGIPHWLIDIVDPDEQYSVSSFRQQAIMAIEDILSRGKVPILAGGTMMYFNALVHELSPLPEADPKVRESIAQQIDSIGMHEMHKRLASFDPQSAERIHENDPQRMIRAFEVYQLTGKNISELQATKLPALPYDFLQFTIMPDDRAVIHQRIAQRFDMMLTQGFEQELKQLRAKYSLHADLPSMRSVGYRQMWMYQDGEYSYAEMRERGIIATRQLAKRQITWLRGWPKATGLQTGDGTNIDSILQIMGSSL